MTATCGDRSGRSCHLQGPRSEPQVRELEGRFPKVGQNGARKVQGSCSEQWVALALPIMAQRSLNDGTSDSVTGDYGTRGLRSTALIDDSVPSTLPPHPLGCPLTLCRRAPTAIQTPLLPAGSPCSQDPHGPHLTYSASDSHLPPQHLPSSVPHTGPSTPHSRAYRSCREGHASLP